MPVPMNVYVNWNLIKQKLCSTGLAFLKLIILASRLVSYINTLMWLQSYNCIYSKFNIFFYNSKCWELLSSVSQWTHLHVIEIRWRNYEEYFLNDASSILCILCFVKKCVYLLLKHCANKVLNEEVSPREKDIYWYKKLKEVKLWRKITIIYFCLCLLLLVMLTK